MTRTQAKILITEAEAEAYNREAERFGVPVAVWAVQVLRSEAGLEAMAVPKAKSRRTRIPTDSTLSHQFKIRLTDEENDATVDATAGLAWSEWVRRCLRAQANVG